MCGIAGMLSDRGGADARATVEAMLSCARHRGPDQLTSFRLAPDRPHWAVGTARLAINDQRPSGMQPFASEDGQIVAVANGEIYNWRELREDLCARGHRFRSECDVEILPHLFEEDGADMLGRLNGMFALAVVDLRHDILLMARDPVGEKPLFYSRAGGRILFASDIAALLASRLVPRELSAASIVEFLTYRSVPAPNTILSSVSRVPPGGVARFDLRSGRHTVKRYWMPDMWQERITDEPEAMERLDAAIDASVRLRTATEPGMPVGATLSGGIDSSTVTAWAIQHLPDAHIEAFSVDVLDDPEDRGCIAMVRDHCGLASHLAPCRAEDIRLLPQIVQRLGEPLGAGMIVPAWQCFRLAHEHGYRVLLSGEGSDELFAGYSGRLVLDGVLRRWPSMSDLDQRMALEQSGKLRLVLARAQLGDPGEDPLDRYDWWQDDNTYDEVLRRELLGDLADEFDPRDRLRWLDEASEGAPHETRMLWLETQIRLEGFMLPIVDRTSMASSVESRAPLLDPAVVECGFALAPELKVRDGVEKHVLRTVAAARGLLPPEILWRKKHPFAGPIPVWMADLPRPLRDALKPDRVNELGLNGEAAARMLEACNTGALKDAEAVRASELLYGLLVLQLWKSLVLDGEPLETYADAADSVLA
jgi:asparagine synthase (glutamine-hydrolysing)